MSQWNVTTTIQTRSFLCTLTWHDMSPNCQYLARWLGPFMWPCPDSPPFVSIHGPALRVDARVVQLREALAANPHSIQVLRIWNDYCAKENMRCAKRTSSDSAAVGGSPPFCALKVWLMGPMAMESSF